jgi:hypothetical protein
MMIAAIIVNIIFLLGMIVAWQRKQGDMIAFFWPSLLFKLACGILLGIVYSYYYNIGDTFGFFDDGVTLAVLARKDFIKYISFLWSGDDSFSIWSQLNLVQPRSLFLSKIVSVFNLITCDNYWLTSVYFSLISFAASWRLVKIIARHFPDIRGAAIVAFLFLPSVIFWGSGIIKESIGIAMLCFLSGTFLKIWKDEETSLKEWIMTVVAVWILWNVKYYFAAVFIPVAFATYVTGRILIPALNTNRKGTEVLLWFLVFVLPVVGISFIHPNFYPGNILGVIVSNYQAFEFISHPGDMIRFEHLEATGKSMLANSPWALVSGLFRPFLWEAGNLFQLTAAVENIFLMVMVIFSVKNINRLWQSPDRLLVLALLVYSVVLCVFITLSTPNFGTLSRYRIGYIPFFALLIMARNPVVAKLENLVQRFGERLAM